MLVLRTLQWGPRHGHGIGQAIRSQSDDLLRVETGSLYPALHRLEKRGWLKAEWGVSEANQKAKYYRLTAAGKAQLLREQDRWSLLVDAIGRVMKPAPAGEGVDACGPARRARRRDPRPHGDQHPGADRARRGPRGGALAAMKEFGNLAADARVDAGRSGARAGSRRRSRSSQDLRVAFRSLRARRAWPRPWRDARARHRRQRRGLQRRPPGAVPARSSTATRTASSTSARARPASAPRTRPSRCPRSATCASRSTTIAAFGDFSTIDFTLVGFGEPRVVQAGVVSGSYFEVMGLRPVLGRLIGRSRRRAGGGARGGPDPPLLDDLAAARRDGDRQLIRLGSRNATVIGVLEPSLPYPADTELIANVVTSPHHLGATMVDGAHAPHDRALRPARARGQRRDGARRARGGPRRDDARSTPRPTRRARASSCACVRCATSSRRRRAPCCCCCWPPPAWSSRSPARTSPT